ncbi:hypothetical protein CERSUDRAFT_91990 [Gelatoporia subvermispora B]|uniref:Uncharacterized protein n=1 Tax=Ceriporiopsis subvermispora (strain B) TaxID=914234 RepID=M2QQZ3_CERS8|nr:hypothetical protein CERSUDRAFT_91990 [Gelatoporia subvermispora B]
MWFERLSRSAGDCFGPYDDLILSVAAIGATPRSPKHFRCHPELAAFLRPISRSAGLHKFRVYFLDMAAPHLAARRLSPEVPELLMSIGETRSYHERDLPLCLVLNGLRRNVVQDALRPDLYVKALRARGMSTDTVSDPEAHSLRCCVLASIAIIGRPAGSSPDTPGTQREGTV